MDKHNFSIDMDQYSLDNMESVGLISKTMYNWLDFFYFN
jgi:hypothetical protein